MPKLFLGSALLTSSVLFSFVLPSAAQVPSAACNTVIHQGTTVNWMTLVNGLPFLVEEFLGLTLFVLMAASQPPRPTKPVELDL